MLRNLKVNDNVYTEGKLSNEGKIEINTIYYFNCFVIIFYILDDVCGIGVCNLFGVYYEKWFPYNWLHLIIILLMSIAIFFMGMFISGRKEFLNAK